MAKKALISVGVLVLCLFSYVCGWESHSAYVRQQLLAALQEASGGIRAPAAPGKPPLPNSAEPAGPALRIKDVSGKVTEANDVWSKFAWRLKVGNDGDESASFTALIQFVDKDGYIVDEDRQYDMVVAAHEERTFSGFKLIDASVAGNVKSVSAKIQNR
jgi:hypothetical protein